MVQAVSAPSPNFLWLLVNLDPLFFLKKKFEKKMSQKQCYPYLPDTIKGNPLNDPNSKFVDLNTYSALYAAALNQELGTISPSKIPNITNVINSNGSVVCMNKSLPNAAGQQVSTTYCTDIKNYQPDDFQSGPLYCFQDNQYYGTYSCTFDPNTCANQK